MTRDELKQLIAMGKELVDDMTSKFKDAQKDVLAASNVDDIFSTPDFTLMVALWASFIPRLSRMKTVNEDGSVQPRDPLFEAVPATLLLAFMAGAMSSFDMKFGEKMRAFREQLASNPGSIDVVRSSLMMEQAHGAIQQSLESRIRHFLGEESNDDE